MAALGGRVAVVSDALSNRRLDAVAELIAQSGAQAIEPTVGAGGHVPTTADAHGASSCFGDLGLAICGAAATGASPLGSGALFDAVEIAEALGAPFLRVFAPAFKEGQSADHQIAAVGRDLSDLSAHAGQGLRVLLEPSAGTIAASPELARSVLRSTPADRSGIVFDPGSLVEGGYLEPPIALAVLDGLIGHVHVKDRALVRTDGAWHAEHRRLGEGRVDWPGTLGRLAADGYEGWLSIDHLSSRSREDAVLRRDVRALERLAQAAEAALSSGPA